ncbi:calcium/sodium antiporter [Paracrocinitomix mangrovi]|uniref:calcium/sodium antiporter n=1 Tax=Paracrocinitomix mangrovi TaxID=2862509 RepID=UPI001C8D42C7|nr:calcium/sodium antiporter [Paracrocinitomix mangrovi]UKN02756.1 calcium/sodium antiporter [Paracrocinitomix mangrovi]
MMYLLLILGLVTLIVGGEFLVRGAVGIAKKAQVSTLVIGMTVISFGTSAPELFVSIDAALDGNPEIAIGNVVGSNIANIALVLGITVLIFPIAAGRNSKIIDWPMMMLATILFFVFSLDLEIQTWEGIVLFGILVIFTFGLIRNSRRTMKKNKAAAEDDDEEISKVKDKIGISLLFTLGGLVGLYFGAEWLVEGAIKIAESFGMEKRVIAVTVVAFGTSVPELVTSAVAAFKKETDISVGNLIGSNIFNIMAVIGITSIVKPIGVEAETINFDMWWVLGIALALLPMMIIGKKIGRLKGAILLSSYVVYISLLVMSIN